jgi:hypothetical protein
MPNSSAFANNTRHCEQEPFYLGRTFATLLPIGLLLYSLCISFFWHYFHHISAFARTLCFCDPAELYTMLTIEQEELSVQQEEESVNLSVLEQEQEQIL